VAATTSKVGKMKAKGNGNGIGIGIGIEIVRGATRCQLISLKGMGAPMYMSLCCAWVAAHFNL